MFIGSHSISMDAKGRMAIPTRVRDALAEACGGRFVITASPDDSCLLLYPEPRWQQILPAISQLPTNNRQSRRTKRILIGHAVSFEMDSNGRVLVPPTLREFADLEKKLMLVGQGDKYELWSEDRWHACLDESGDDDEVPEALKSLDY